MARRFLEYIQGSSKQYINTNYKPSYQTSVIIDVQVTGTVPACIFGGRSQVSATDVSSFTLFALDANSYRFDRLGTMYNTELAPTVRRTITITPTQITIDGTTTNLSSTTRSSNYNMYVTSVNTNGTPDERSGVRLYSMKIYDNGTLVRDFVPCNQDGSIGLYDKANKVFYPNLGSTPYTAGPELPSVNGQVNVNGQWRDISAAYVNVNGTWKEATAMYVNVNGTWKESV